MKKDKMPESITRQSIALIVVALTSITMLSACGGGGGSDTPTKTEVINGITVPVAPDEATNNATLAGVDSNANGVRDDIERYIAKNMPSAKLPVESVAVVTQKILLGESISSQQYKDALCGIYDLKGTSIDEKGLMLEILNTDDRFDKYYQNIASAGYVTPDCSTGVK